MDKRRWGQWILLAVVCLSFSIGESYAQKNDFANLRRYSKENAALPQATKKDKRVIFMGNSITEGWVRTHPDFFKSNGYIGRGISGQTSYQFLLRFREDVINLSPALVVINAGTNDVAENTQTYNEDYTFGNIVSMAELAKANHIKVVLCSVLPAYDFPWRKDMKPADKVIALNKMIKDYALKNKITYVDYHTVLKDEKNGLSKEIAEDGIHPTKLGYEKMEAILMKNLK